jgi:hypothetical protein
LNERTTASSSTRSVEIPERRSTVVKDRIDALEDFRKQPEGADVDLLREMVKVFAEQLMGADADALCGADYGERSRERVTDGTAIGNAPGHSGRHDRACRSRSCGARQDRNPSHPIPPSDLRETKPRLWETCASSLQPYLRSLHLIVPHG